MTDSGTETQTWHPDFGSLLNSTVNRLTDNDPSAVIHFEL